MEGFDWLWDFEYQKALNAGATKSKEEIDMFNMQKEIMDELRRQDEELAEAEELGMLDSYLMAAYESEMMYGDDCGFNPFMGSYDFDC